jgi:hypothetical protein
MPLEKFIGTWKLVSSEFHSSNGQVSYPWGKEVDGRLIYTADGNVAVQIMSPGRPNFAAKDHMNGTDREIRAAFEGYQAYYGTFTLSELEKTITHHIQGSVYPNLIGHNLKRFFNLSDNQLTLSTPPMPMGGEKVTGVLIWTRT